MPKKLEPAEGKPKYTSFLIDKLNKIYEAWDDNQEELALNRSIKLWYFLPKPLKDKLQKAKLEITEALNKAYKVQGVDFFTRQQNRNREANRVAHHYLSGFINEMTDWLYEAGYFEEKKRVVREGHE